MRRAAAGGTLLGAGAGALLAFLELGWRASTFKEAFLHTWDTVRFAGYAWSVLVLAGAIVGVSLGVLSVLVAKIAEQVSRKPRAIRANKVRLYALLATPVAAWMLASLFTGRRARQLPQRDLWAVGAGMVLIAVLTWICRAVLKAKEEIGRGRSRPSHGMLTALGLLFGAAVLYALDQTLWPRLYPVFHVALAAASFVACMFGLAAFYQTFRLDSLTVRRIARPRRAWALFLAVGAVGFASLTQFARHQTMRALAFEHTSFLAYALRAANRVHLLGPAAPSGQIRSLKWNEQPASGISGPAFPGRDIFLITIDALRADHLGVYGYPRGVSPTLDQLAQESIVFERAYAQVPHTSFSLASLLCSRYVYALAALGDSRKCQTMAEYLRRQGWSTAAFFPPAIFYIEPERFATYEKSKFGFEHVRYDHLDAGPRVDQIIAYLDKQRPRRTFVWAHFFEPHEPYDVHSSFDFGKEAVDRYDGEIAWLDRSLDRLLKHIRKERPEAIIIVTADHGEEFGEHGGRYHGTSLYDDQVRVPLLMYVPGLAHARIAPAVELIDVFPTVLGFLGLDPPNGIAGTDLGPWIASTAEERSQMPPAFVELESRKAIVYGKHKLICDIAYGFCELFNLKTDPRERRNLVAEQPEVEKELRGLLAGWMDDRTVELQAGTLDDEKWRKPIERARMGDRESVVGLAELLLHSSPEVRTQAAQLIAGFPPDQRIRPAIEKAFAADKKNPWLTASLAAFCDSAALDQLAHVVTKDPPLAARGGLILEQCKHAGAGKLLAVGVASKDMALRRQVILALGRLKDPAYVPVLLPYLEGVLERYEVVSALRMIGDRSTVPMLVERLRTDPYAPVRSESARALGTMCGQVGEQALRHRLAAEEDTTVVGSIVYALWKCGALDGAIRGGVGVVEAKRGELWVGRTPHATDPLILVAPQPRPVNRSGNSAGPSDAGASSSSDTVRKVPASTPTTQAQARPTGEVERFEVPVGKNQVQVKGPAAFLFAR